MKRFLTFLALMICLSAPAFSQIQSEPEETEPSQEVSYKTNGKGDQFLRLAVMGNFPLNFGEQLYIGGAAQLGYYRFLNGWLGLGAELMAGYNPTLGSNIFTYVPITFGVMFQPYVWKFEFPVILSVGGAFETCNNKKYFPGFIAKAELNAYYRFSENFSLGLGTDLVYMPEWYTSTKGADSDYGLFMTASISARYHF